MPPTETLRPGERGGAGGSGTGGPEQTYIIRQSNKYYEHRDSQATAMSVDYSGQWVLLAGRGYLALQRLGQEDGSLRRHERQSKYEVSVAEFAICPSRKEYCAIATSQHIDIVRWGTAEPHYEMSLRGHTRTVTDIDWHGKNPNLLVSCSIDTFSHIWDLREPRKPALSLNAVCMSGATQVGFNRVSGNLLAAAHDGDLRIWDIRKGSCPTHYITAHLNRVHGINWSHKRETCLATASQDGTVKYFDVCNPRRAEKIITTMSPVWRARYTPIGNGLVSIVVPHLGRGENSLLLWSNSKQTDPICSFVGHTDVILDFAWRPNRESSTEIELVTWSRDRTLRVWKIDDNMLKLCEPSAEEEETRFEPDLSELRVPTPPEFLHPRSILVAASLPISTGDGASNTLPMARSPSFGGGYYRREEPHIARSLTDQPTCSLHHEFSLLNTNMPHVEVDTLDAIKRYACFKICAGGHTVILQVTFATSYPSPSAPPDFQFCQGTTLSNDVSGVLLKVLRCNALQRVKKSRTCLEQCLRALVAAMKKKVAAVGGADRSQLLLQSPRLEGALSSTLHDACIPYPRTSGVHFNAIGMLTTFAQPVHNKRLTLRQHTSLTPRTFSAINGSGLLGNVMATAQRDANASFYLQERMISGKPGKQRAIRQMNGSPVVHVYDTSSLLHINRGMAREFSLDKLNIAETCRKNGEICRKHGRLDLVPVWLLAELIATPQVPHETLNELLFYKDPFKKSLLESLIMHYATSGDIQTAVLLACLFDKCPTGGNAIMEMAVRLPPQLNSQISPYHTVLPLDVKSSSSSNTWQQLKQLRSNSWSDSFDLEVKQVQSDAYPCSLIRRAKVPLFDQFKRAYAEVLFGWQLLSKRALVLKHTQNMPPPVQGVEFVTECGTCAKPKRTPKCEPCKRPVLFCVLCRLPVKGAANACLACGHGGHMDHMMQWFEKHEVCATCGCKCLERTSELLALLS
ncbi:LOW QUALITY PROTEIN: GATOR complex protein Wdr59 [Drosophila eugracilis]|uniref:LOW QUALITY PROTEIN: GATOR complex protein Wdr59 n=1 Tax=Drosophila eugracilis TaxID=29029 RepID=UPI0007E7164E|nr:LOW QUALITY PROTEIN: GATOR complex protein Wdr59 [Drosophila eugracilis]